MDIKNLEILLVLDDESILKELQKNLIFLSRLFP
tara:strand:+ start:170 stop:271 length:102 start_codon:yes stop_codon:yes gene_type:complete